MRIFSSVIIWTQISIFCFSAVLQSGAFISPAPGSDRNLLFFEHVEHVINHVPVVVGGPDYLQDNGTINKKAMTTKVSRIFKGYLFACACLVNFLNVSCEIPLTTQPANSDWSFSLGNKSVISQASFPAEGRGYFTDSNIPVLKMGNQYYAFWSSFRSFRTVASTPFLQDHAKNLTPATAITGSRQPDNGTSNGFNDGGMWMIGVEKLNDGRLAGFFHAESHWYPRNTYGYTAYKSLGICYSSDSGKTWSAPVQLLKHQQNKPASPAWSGLGDACVIYNKAKGKFYAYYAPSSGMAAISMACSSDPTAAPGSWKKWYRGSFSQPGMGGAESAISNLSSKPGGNPSVHWNTYLNKYIMAWHGWDGKMYISASADGESWESPRLLLEDGPRAWYPVLIGSSSTEGGQSMTMYYACDFKDDGTRSLVYRTITFTKK